MGNCMYDIHTANQIASELPYNTLFLRGHHAQGEHYAANGLEGMFLGQTQLGERPALTLVLHPFLLEYELQVHLLSSLRNV